MTAPTDLLALRSRLQEAKGADTELDLALERLLLDGDDWVVERDEMARTAQWVRPVEDGITYIHGGARSYTSSLGAIVELIERVLPGYSWSVRRSGFGSPADGELWNPRFTPGETNSWKGWSGNGCAALALCLALVEALIAKTEQERG